MGLLSGKCDRCGAQGVPLTMSYFNTQEICMDCEDKEQRDPRYQQARKAEEAAVRRGDYNFPGIGGYNVRQQ